MKYIAFACFDRFFFGMFHVSALTLPSFENLRARNVSDNFFFSVSLSIWQFLYRLTCVSLFWAKPTFESEDKDVILNFFASQKELESIECQLKEDRHLKPYNQRRFAETLTSIALHILSTCFELRKLYFCSSLNWLPSQEKTIHTLFTKTCKLEKFAVGKLLVEGCTMRSWGSSRFGHTYQRTIRVLPPYYPHLVHLILREKIEYDVLERVFKYMVQPSELYFH